ncbi:MAG: LysR family transcriptional regulator [Steroidobacteraceae bacterium]
MLERGHLMIVREVARQGSMTAAAEKLHLTQSALSHAMRKLELGLGTPMWERQGRSLRLTQAGTHLLELANRVLPQLEQAEQTMADYARGVRGSLHIGMECHPCYQWLLKVMALYMPQWPDVDVDVKQKFRFGGIGALLDHEIDMLVTPDPEAQPGLYFEPVFDYEQVLVVSRSHALAGAQFVEPAQLAGEVLITYPVETDRLDVYNLFLTPAGVHPRVHKTIESTDLMLQMVAVGRGVAALPRWLVEEHAASVPVAPVRLGRLGVLKQIHLGLREADRETGYVRAFIQTARGARELRNTAIATRD